MYSYEQSTSAFFKTFAAQLDLAILQPWKIDIPPPRKFDKFKRQQVDDVAVAAATALVARPLKDATDARNKYITKGGYQAPVYNLI